VRWPSRPRLGAREAELTGQAQGIFEGPVMFLPNGIVARFAMNKLEAQPGEQRGFQPDPAQCEDPVFKPFGETPG